VPRNLPYSCIGRVDVAIDMREQRQPSATEISISHGYRAAADVRHSGGDFLTFASNHDGTLSFAIGDVSAKGMAGDQQARQLCRAARMAMMLTRRASPILESVSEAFYRLIAPQSDEYSACVAAGTFDPRGSVLHYAAAGTEAAIVVRNLANHEHLGPTGPLIGASQAVSFGEVSVPFESGCALLLFTDGIVESRGSDGKLLGTCGLMQLVRRSIEKRIVPCSSQLLHEVDRHCHGAYRDDATLAIALALDPGV
jgi:serine phosphatase RsbU (regulator of sigma subunit)